MLRSNLAIWPGKQSTADDIAIPLILDFRPFDPSEQLTPIPIHSVTICPKCKAVITKLFPELNKKRICPFCSTVCSNPEKDQLYFDNFCIDQYIPTLRFALCLILDLSCDEEFAHLNRAHLNIALDALLPNSRFILGIIKKDYLSFVSMSDDASDYSMQHFKMNCSHVFDKIDVNNLLIRAQNRDMAHRAINEQFDITPMRIHHLPLGSMLMLTQKLARTLIVKPVVFSSNTLDPKNATSFAFDWISPLDKYPGIYPSKGRCIEMGSPSIYDPELQVTALIQRLFLSQNAYNVDIQVHVPKTMDVIPQVPIHIPHVSESFSQMFSVALTQRYVNYSEVHVEVQCTFTTILRDGRLISRRMIVSHAFPTTTCQPLLINSIDPMLTAKGYVSRREELQEMLLRLNDAYQSYVVKHLPGEHKHDPLFLLMPKLQWLYQSLFNPNNVPVRFDIDAVSEAALLTPCVTFWASPFERCKDDSPLDKHLVLYLSNWPIAMIDRFDKIEVFVDFDSRPGNNTPFATELERRVQSRFPVPIVQYRARADLESALSPDLDSRFARFIYDKFPANAKL